MKYGLRKSIALILVSMFVFNMLPWNVVMALGVGEGPEYKLVTYKQTGTDTYVAQSDNFQKGDIVKVAIEVGNLTQAYSEKGMDGIISMQISFTYDMSKLTLLNDEEGNSPTSSDFNGYMGADVKTLQALSPSQFYNRYSYTFKPFSTNASRLQLVYTTKNDSGKKNPFRGGEVVYALFEVNETVSVGDVIPFTLYKAGSDFTNAEVQMRLINSSDTSKTYSVGEDSVDGNPMNFKYSNAEIAIGSVPVTDKVVKSAVVTSPLVLNNGATIGSSTSVSVLVTYTDNTSETIVVDGVGWTGFFSNGPRTNNMTRPFTDADKAKLEADNVSYPSGMPITWELRILGDETDDYEMNGVVNNDGSANDVLVFGPEDDLKEGDVIHYKDSESDTWHTVVVPEDGATQIEIPGGILKPEEGELDYYITVPGTDFQSDEKSIPYPAENRPIVIPDPGLTNYPNATKVFEITVPKNTPFSDLYLNGLNNTFDIMVDDNGTQKTLSAFVDWSTIGNGTTTFKNMWETVWGTTAGVKDVWYTFPQFKDAAGNVIANNPNGMTVEFKFTVTETDPVKMIESAVVTSPLVLKNGTFISEHTVVTAIVTYTDKTTEEITINGKDWVGFSPYGPITLDMTRPFTDADKALLSAPNVSYTPGMPITWELRILGPTTDYEMLSPINNLNPAEDVLVFPDDTDLKAGDVIHYKDSESDTWHTVVVPEDGATSITIPSGILRPEGDDLVLDYYVTVPGTDFESTQKEVGYDPEPLPIVIDDPEEPNHTDVTKYFEITVPYGSDFSKLYENGLNNSFEVTIDNDGTVTKVQAYVDWSTILYDTTNTFKYMWNRSWRNQLGERNLQFVFPQFKDSAGNAIAQNPNNLITYIRINVEKLKAISGVTEPITTPAALGTAAEDVERPKTISITLSDGTTLSVTAPPTLNWTSTDYNPSVPGTYTFTVPVSDLPAGVLPPHIDPADAIVTWQVQVGTQTQTQWYGSAQAFNNRPEEGIQDYIEVSGLTVGDFVILKSDKDGTNKISLPAPKDGLNRFDLGDDFFKHIEGSVVVSVQSPGKTESQAIVVLYNYETPYMSADKYVDEITIPVFSTWSDLEEKLPSYVTVLTDRSMMSESGTANVDIPWADAQFNALRSIDTTKPGYRTIEITPPNEWFRGAVAKNDYVPTQKKIYITIKIVPEKVILAAGERDGKESVNVPQGTSANEIPLPDTIILTLKDGTKKEVPASGLGLVWSPPAGYNPNIAGEYTFTSPLTGLGDAYDTTGVVATWNVAIGNLNPAVNFTVLEVANNRTPGSIANDMITLSGVEIGDKVLITSDLAGTSKKTITVTSLTPEGTAVLSLGYDFIKQTAGNVWVEVARDGCYTSTAQQKSYKNETPYVKVDVTLPDIKVPLGTSWDDLLIALNKNASVVLGIDRTATSLSGTVNHVIDWETIKSSQEALANWDAYKNITTDANGIQPQIEIITEVFNTGLNPEVENPYGRKIIQRIIIGKLEVDPNLGARAEDTHVAYNTDKTSIQAPKYIKIYLKDRANPEDCEIIPLAENMDIYVPLSAWVGSYNKTVPGRYTQVLDLTTLRTIIPELNNYNVDYATWDIYVDPQGMTSYPPVDSSGNPNVTVKNNKTREDLHSSYTEIDIVEFKNLPVADGLPITVVINSDNGMGTFTKVLTALEIQGSTATVELPLGFLKIQGGAITYTVANSGKTATNVRSVSYKREVPYMSQNMSLYVQVPYGSTWDEVRTILTNTLNTVNVVTDKKTAPVTMTAAVSWNDNSGVWSNKDNKAEWNSKRNNVKAEAAIIATINSLTDGLEPAGLVPNNVNAYNKTITVYITEGTQGTSPIPLDATAVNNPDKTNDFVTIKDYPTDDKNTTFRVYDDKGNKIGEITVPGSTDPTTVDIPIPAGYNPSTGGTVYVTAQRDGEKESNPKKPVTYGPELVTIKSIEVFPERFVPVGTSAGTVYAQLPTQAKVTLSDNREVIVSLGQWTGLPGTLYADWSATATAPIINLPSGITNPNNITATILVTAKDTSWAIDPLEAKATNNKGTNADILTLPVGGTHGIQEGDIIRIYKNATDTTPIYTSSPIPTITDGIFNISTNILEVGGGTIYVTRETTKPTAKGESGKTAVLYSREKPYMLYDKALAPAYVDVETTGAQIWEMLQKELTTKVVTDKDNTGENMDADFTWVFDIARWDSLNKADYLASGITLDTIITRIYDNYNDGLSYNNDDERYGNVNGKKITKTFYFNAQTEPVENVTFVNRLGTTLDTLTAYHPDNGENVLITVYREMSDGTKVAIGSGYTNGTGKVTIRPPYGLLENPPGTGEWLYFTAKRENCSVSPMVAFQAPLEQVALESTDDLYLQVTKGTTLSALESQLPTYTGGSFEDGTRAPVYTFGGKTISTWTGTYDLNTSGQYILYANVDTLQLPSGYFMDNEVKIRLILDVVSKNQSSTIVIKEVINEKTPDDDVIEFVAGSLVLNDIIRIYTSKDSTSSVYSTTVTQEMVDSQSIKIPGNILIRTGDLTNGIFVTRLSPIAGKTESEKVSKTYKREVPSMNQNVQIQPSIVISESEKTDSTLIPSLLLNILAEMQEKYPVMAVPTDSSGNEDGKMNARLDWNNMPHDDRLEAIRLIGEAKIGDKIQIKCYPDAPLTDLASIAGLQPEGDNRYDHYVYVELVIGQKTLGTPQIIDSQNNIGATNDSITVYYDDKGQNVKIYIYNYDENGNPLSLIPWVVETYGKGTVEFKPVIGGLNANGGYLRVAAQEEGKSISDLYPVNTPPTGYSKPYKYDKEKKYITSIVLMGTLSFGQDLDAASRETNYIAYDGTTPVGEVIVKNPVWENTTTPNYDKTVAFDPIKYKDPITRLGSYDTATLESNDYAIAEGTKLEWLIRVIYPPTEAIDKNYITINNQKSPHKQDTLTITLRPEHSLYPITKDDIIKIYKLVDGTIDDWELVFTCTEGINGTRNIDWKDIYGNVILDPRGRTELTSNIAVSVTKAGKTESTITRRIPYAAEPAYIDRDTIIRVTVPIGTTADQLTKGIAPYLSSKVMVHTDIEEENEEDEYREVEVEWGVSGFNGNKTGEQTIYVINILSSDPQNPGDIYTIKAIITILEKSRMPEEVLIINADINDNVVVGDKVGNDKLPAGTVIDIYDEDPRLNPNAEPIASTVIGPDGKAPATIEGLDPNGGTLWFVAKEDGKTPSDAQPIEYSKRALVFKGSKAIEVNKPLGIASTTPGFYPVYAEITIGEEGNTTNDQQVKVKLVTSSWAADSMRPYDKDVASGSEAYKFTADFDLSTIYSLSEIPLNIQVVPTTAKFTYLVSTSDSTIVPIAAIDVTNNVGPNNDKVAIDYSKQSDVPKPPAGTDIYIYDQPVGGNMIGTGKLDANGKVTITVNPTYHLDPKGGKSVWAAAKEPGKDIGPREEAPYLAEPAVITESKILPTQTVAKGTLFAQLGLENIQTMATNLWGDQPINIEWRLGSPTGTILTDTSALNTVSLSGHTIYGVPVEGMTAGTPPYSVANPNKHYVMVTVIVKDISADLNSADYGAKAENNVGKANDKVIIESLGSLKLPDDTIIYVYPSKDTPQSEGIKGIIRNGKVTIQPYSYFNDLGGTVWVQAEEPNKYPGERREVPYGPEPSTIPEDSIIESVVKPEILPIAAGTLQANIPFQQTFTAVLADGKGTIPVTFTQDNSKWLCTTTYNPNKAGDYTFLRLVDENLPANVTNPNNVMAEFTVRIEASADLSNSDIEIINNKVDGPLEDLGTIMRNLNKDDIINVYGDENLANRFATGIVNDPLTGITIYLDTANLTHEEPDYVWITRTESGKAPSAPRRVAYKAEPARLINTMLPQVITVGKDMTYAEVLALLPSRGDVDTDYTDTDGIKANVALTWMAINEFTYLTALGNGSNTCMLTATSPISTGVTDVINDKNASITIRISIENKAKTPQPDGITVVNNPGTTPDRVQIDDPDLPEGTIITVKDPQGNIIGTGEIGPDGKADIPVGVLPERNPADPDGTVGELDVIAEAPNATPSDPETVPYNKTPVNITKDVVAVKSMLPGTTYAQIKAYFDSITASGVEVELSDGTKATLKVGALTPTSFSGTDGSHEFTAQFNLSVNNPGNYIQNGFNKMFRLYINIGTTIAPAKNDIAVENADYRSATEFDTITVHNRTPGEVVKVYATATSTTPIGTATANASGIATIVLSNPIVLAHDGKDKATELPAEIYVTTTKDGLAESNRVAQTYNSEKWFVYKNMELNQNTVVDALKVPVGTTFAQLKTMIDVRYADANLYYTPKEAPIRAGYGTPIGSSSNKVDSETKVRVSWTQGTFNSAVESSTIFEIQGDMTSLPQTPELKVENPDNYKYIIYVMVVARTTPIGPETPIGPTDPENPQDPTREAVEIEVENNRQPYDPNDYVTIDGSDYPEGTVFRVYDPLGNLLGEGEKGTDPEVEIALSEPNLLNPDGGKVYVTAEAPDKSESTKTPKTYGPEQRIILDLSPTSNKQIVLASTEAIGTTPANTRKPAMVKAPIDTSPITMPELPVIWNVNPTSSKDVMVNGVSTKEYTYIGQFIQAEHESQNIINPLSVYPVLVVKMLPQTDPIKDNNPSDGIADGATAQNYKQPLVDTVTIDPVAAGLKPGDTVRIYKDPQATQKIGEIVYNGGTTPIIIPVGVYNMDDNNPGHVYATRQENSPVQLAESKPKAVPYAEITDPPILPNWKAIGVKALPDVYVDYNTPELNAKNALSNKIIVTFDIGNGQTVDVEFEAGVSPDFTLNWNTSSYNPTTVYYPSTGYTKQPMTATFTLPAGLTINSGVVARQNILVREPSYMPTEADVAVTNTPTGEGPDKVVVTPTKPLPAGTKITVYDIDDVDMKNPLAPAQTTSGTTPVTFDLPNIAPGLYPGGGSVRVKVEEPEKTPSTMTKDYPAEDTIPAPEKRPTLDTPVDKATLNGLPNPLTDTVYLGTAFANVPIIQANQPMMLLLDYSYPMYNGTYTPEVPVVWDISTYDATKPGVYEVYGTLQVSSDEMNLNGFAPKAIITVVDPNKEKPTIEFANGNINTSVAPYDVNNKWAGASKPSTVLVLANDKFKDPGFTVRNGAGSVVTPTSVRVEIWKNGAKVADIANYTAATDINGTGKLNTDIITNKINTMNEGTYELRYFATVNGLESDAHTRLVQIRYQRGDLDRNGRLQGNDLVLLGDYLLELIPQNGPGINIVDTDLFNAVANIDRTVRVSDKAETVQGNDLVQLGDYLLELIPLWAEDFTPIR